MHKINWADRICDWTDKEKYQENPFKQDVANKRTGYSKLIGQVYV